MKNRKPGQLTLSGLLCHWGYKVNEGKEKTEPQVNQQSDRE